MKAAATSATALVVMTLAGARGRAAPDPIAMEIDRWSAFVKSNTATDEIWKQIRDGSAAALGRAAEALRAGRRLLALQRLAYAREDLSAAMYMGERSAAERKDTAGFEAEWKRMGGVLRDDLAPPRADALAGVQPAALRALGEAALPQVRVYYEASLEYGRNTMPDSGLFYLGSAQAQRDFVAFARTLAERSSLRAPAVRALGPELDALDAEMLAAYRPPLSIDKHPQFITASSLLKEARELDGAGLRYGALLRYLQATNRFAPLRTTPPALDAAALAAELGRAEERLKASGADHSLGRLFLETAQSEATTASGAANAAAITADVLPSAVFIPLERLFARREDQPVFRRGWRTDLTYFFVSSLLVQVTTLLTLKPAMVFFDWARHPAVAAAVQSLPFAAQFAGILVLTDLTQYGVHRLFHAVPALWRFHAIHHSAEAMDWLAGSRLHLVDVAVTRGLTYVPIYVLGFAEAPLFAYVAFVSIQATFIHSNLRFAFAPLRWLLATPQFHHWHHAAEREAVDKNFAVHLPVLDRIFGTYYQPEGRWPKSYGLAGGAAMPDGYLRQLVHPLRKRAS